MPGDAKAAREALHEALADVQRFLNLTPEVVAADLHPDYASTAWARAHSSRAICRDASRP